MLGRGRLRQSQLSGTTRVEPAVETASILWVEAEVRRIPFSKPPFCARLEVEMSDLLLGALSLLLATNQPAAVSNYVSARLAPFTTLAGVTAVDPNDPLEVEFQKLLRADDEGETEIDRLIAEGLPPDPSRAQTPVTKREAMRRRLLEIINRVRGEYEAFLKLHPDHVRARLAYGDFLDMHGDDSEVLEQLEVALKLDPKNPVVWNNFAGHFAHVGPITNAFHAYEKALELRPYEPLYHYNYGTVVFLYRVDAQKYFNCDETAVFERALNEYKECRRLAPRVFRYAFEYAQTFYGVKPEPAETPEGRRAAEQRLADRALTAWREALSIADNDTDREGIYLHFARWQVKAGRWDDARESLSMVTRPEHDEVKRRIQRNLTAREISPDDDPVPRAPITAPKLEFRP